MVVDSFSRSTYRTWQNRREFRMSQGWLRRQRWPWNRGQTASCPHQGLHCNECCQSDRRRSKYPANTLSDATLNNTSTFSYISYTLQSSKSRYTSYSYIHTYIELQWEKVKGSDIYREPDAHRFTGEVAYWSALSIGSAAQLAVARCPNERTLDSLSAARQTPGSSDMPSRTMNIN